MHVETSAECRECTEMYVLEGWTQGSEELHVRRSCGFSEWMPSPQGSLGAGARLVDSWLGCVETLGRGLHWCCAGGPPALPVFCMACSVSVANQGSLP
jgi:hypothetical protein